MDNGNISKSFHNQQVLARVAILAQHNSCIVIPDLKSINEGKVSVKKILPCQISKYQL